MKLIDKYLLKSCMVPLSFCLAGFSMIVIIFDLFEHFSDFLEAHTPVLDILKYYLFFLPSVVAIIVPISLLLSVLYTLANLTKNNELTAMRASGVSTVRLMSPFIILGLSSTLLVGAMNEWVAPWSMYWTNQFIRLQGDVNGASIYSALNIAFKNEIKHRIWLIGEYDTKTQIMRNINVIQQRDDGSDEYRITAKEGEWLDGEWWFKELFTQNYTPEGQPAGAPKVELNREMSDFTETPNDFANEIKDPEFLSSMEMVHFLRTRRQLSTETIARIEVNLHSRLAMPWTCLIVVLIGIPFGATTGRKGAFLGVVVAIGLFFTYYVLIN
ncbi:MAG: LptF/LptG family permease, partial [Lentisphaerota bacterium]